MNTNISALRSDFVDRNMRESVDSNYIFNRRPFSRSELTINSTQRFIRSWLHFRSLSHRSCVRIFVCQISWMFLNETFQFSNLRISNFTFLQRTVYLLCCYLSASADPKKSAQLCSETFSRLLLSLVLLRRQTFSSKSRLEACFRIIYKCLYVFVL